MTKAQKKIDTHERVLDAAEHLFARNGFEGTSTRSIAAMAEVSIQTMHYHGGSKLELYHKVLERSVMAVSNMINEHIQHMLKLDLNDEQVLVDSLNHLIDDLFEALSAHPNYALLFFRQWLDHSDDSRRVEWERVAPYLRKWIMQVETIVGQDRRGGIDLPMTFMTLSIVYWGLFSNHQFISAFLNMDAQSKEYMERLKAHTKEVTARLLGRKGETEIKPD